MSQIEAVFFDCDGTLVDSEVIALAPMSRCSGNLAFTLTWKRFLPVLKA